MVSKWKNVWLSLCCLILLFGINVSAAETGTKRVDSAKDFAVISEGKTSADTVKPGDVLKYHFKITDVDTKSYSDFDQGIVRVVITWKSDAKQKIIQVFPWNSAGRADKNSLVVDGNIKISKGMRKGIWRIEKIGLSSPEDTDDEMDHHPVQYFTSLNIYNKSLSNKASAVDLSFSEFTVKGTGKMDKDAPEINWKNMSVSKRYVKAGQKSKFRLKVSDKSQIRYVKCTWQHKKKKIGSLHTDDYIMKYNKKKGCYQLALSGGTEKDEYQSLFSIEVCDIYGNKAVYRSSKKKYKAAFAKVTIYNK